MSVPPEAPRIAVVNAGLGSTSLTRVLTRAAADAGREAGADVEHLDVQEDRVLPYGEEGSTGVDNLRRALDEAEGIVLCFPVYNANMNATLKALIEHCSPSLAGKVVGLMVTAGGRFGYMSVLSVVMSLMFDLRTWIVPRHVYAVTQDFDGQRLVNDDIARRVQQLVADTADMARRLR
jgi:NAD(P)H-dependent FMN reductase